MAFKNVQPTIHLDLLCRELTIQLVYFQLIIYQIYHYFYNRSELVFLQARSIFCPSTYTTAIISFYLMRTFLELKRLVLNLENPGTLTTFMHMHSLRLTQPSLMRKMTNVSQQGK